MINTYGLFLKYILSLGEGWTEKQEGVVWGGGNTSMGEFLLSLCSGEEGFDRHRQGAGRVSTARQE